MPVLGIKSQAIIEELLLFQSQTWTCHQTGLVKVVCIGGGGSGGIATGTGSTAGRCSGGGAGGYSEQIIPVTQGDTYTITIGAAGQAKTRNANAPGATAGAAGGASRFVTASGTTIDLNAGGGGAGGAAANNNSGNEEAIAGGAGGSASGGTTNRVGGAGGSIASGGGTIAAAATGGGAVGIRSAVGYAGGDVVPSTSNNATRSGATGGGGIGGAGGSITANVSYSNNSSAGTNGGGTSGPGIDNGSGASPVSTGVPRMASIAGGTGMISNYGETQSNVGSVIETNVGLTTSGTVAVVGNYGSAGMPNSIFGVFGSGGSYKVSGGSNKREQGGPGGGGGGVANTSNDGVPQGGIFSGGGGYVGNVANINVTGVGGPMGGGSGGMFNWASNNAGASGVAGTGVVVIQYLSLT